MSNENMFNVVDNGSAGYRFLLIDNEGRQYSIERLVRIIASTLQDDAPLTERALSEAEHLRQQVMTLSDLARSQHSLLSWKESQMLDGGTLSEKWKSLRDDLAKEAEGLI